KLVPEEDVLLVAYVVDLYNVGTFNANIRFKAIVYDMLRGTDNSDFGWGKHMQIVVAKDAIVIKKLVNSDIVVSLIMTNLSIYVKDRATRKDTQTAIDIVEEIDTEDVVTAKYPEEAMTMDANLMFP
ncbi:hypothetical protein Gogos_011695, partial [Gossypium gossypioides]|nr:hypothetical protein [Gossypium gossypioides]